jgi:hypothetical protein
MGERFKGSWVPSRLCAPACCFAEKIEKAGLLAVEPGQSQE